MVKLRAKMRMGETSRELETAERARTDLVPAGRKQTKEQALAEAGLSTSIAYRYEELVVGRSKKNAKDREGSD